MFSLINKWSTLTFKKYNKEMLHIPCYAFLSTQSHCVILGPHQIFNMSSHSKVHCGSVWNWRTAMGCCAFSFHLHMAGAALHWQDASHKLLPARNRCPWACFLCSFTAHMGGSLLRTQQQFAALFFCAIIFLDIAKYLLLGYSWCI